MISPEDESARAGDGAGFGDAVTFAFGTPAEGLYGSARLGLVPGEPPRASGLGMLFHDGEVAAVGASGGAEVAQADWTDLAVGSVRTTIVDPLRAWDVAFEVEEGGFALRFEALGEPAEPAGAALATSAADLHGYEQACRVTGVVRRGERRWNVACLGQRGHQWGAPDWERIALARTLGVWLEGGDGVVLSAVRPERAAGHEAELVGACLLAAGASVAVADPRLSTTTDGDGRQRRAGLELWIGEEDDLPRRGAGEAVCGTTLELGRLRLDCAFFHWRMDGREGAGRYDVLRRA